jgi:hypothetical protein
LEFLASLFLLFPLLKLKPFVMLNNPAHAVRHRLRHHSYHLGMAIAILSSAVAHSGDAWPGWNAADRLITQIAIS